MLKFESSKQKQLPKINYTSDQETVQKTHDRISNI